MPRPTRDPLASSRDTKPLATVLALLVWALAALPAAPATFQVTDIVDAMPAPEGSLRWAIEQSELNGEPDRIEFIIDGGTIELVAPLPDLREGGLVIGSLRAGPPGGSNGIAVSGRGVVARALAILSPDNGIGELDFIGFAGDEAVLIAGGRAQDNVIAGCGFGRDTAAEGNRGAGVRVRGGEGAPGTPTRTEIRFSRFVNNDAGIVVTGTEPQSTTSGHWTLIRGNEFGTDPLGGPGPGTGLPVRADGATGVFVLGNRFSGPGPNGIVLAAGSDDAEIAGNEIGLAGADLTSCAGFSGSAVRVDGSGAARIRGNGLSCSENGVLLTGGSDGAEILDNRIGGTAAEGHRGHGIAIDASRRALVRRNRIARNDGYGISSGPGPAVEPGNQALLSCNSIFSNGLGASNLPDVALAPPALTSAGVTAVQGDLPEPVAGWVEVFGDDLDEARVFQGAVRVGSDDPPFRHRLPVLGLRVGKGPDGVEIGFDRETPARHTATLSSEPGHETTELSAPLPAASEGLVFDVIRGRLGNLAFAAAGGIDLGPVVCLESGLSPEPAVSPDAVDPELPPPGKGFFYLSRRRNATEAVAGTYDPAICLTDVDDFRGPRSPSSGDCPP